MRPIGSGVLNDGNPQASDATPGTLALRIAMSLIADSAKLDTLREVHLSLLSISIHAFRSCDSNVRLGDVVTKHPEAD